jgi:hypothetical protein
MQEGDVQALSTLAGLRVNDAATLLLYLVQGVLYTILNGKCNVLDAATATVLLNELGDCAVGAGCLKKFNLGLTNFEESGAYVLVLYLFDCEAFETEKFLIERYSLV